MFRLGMVWIKRSSSPGGFRHNILKVQTALDGAQHVVVDATRPVQPQRFGAARVGGDQQHTECWDTPNSVAVVAFGRLKAPTTGKPNRAGEIGKVGKVDLT